jgi:non-heme chloroperoxidase
VNYRCETMMLPCLIIRVEADRPQMFIDLSLPFYSYNRPGAKISQGVRDNFWFQGMQVSIKGAYECIRQFSQTDFTEDLKKIDIPTLILQGDDDQIAPIGASGRKTVKLVKGSTLKVYPGFPHACTRPTRSKSMRIYSRFSRHELTVKWTVYLQSIHVTN